MGPWVFWKDVRDKGISKPQFNLNWKKLLSSFSDRLSFYANFLLKEKRWGQQKQSWLALGEGVPSMLATLLGYQVVTKSCCCKTWDFPKAKSTNAVAGKKSRPRQERWHDHLPTGRLIDVIDAQEENVVQKSCCLIVENHIGFSISPFQ